MKREDLDFLESEQIDKVMSLHGKAITKKNSEIESLTNKNKDLEEKLTTYETKIKEYDEISKDNAEWKVKFEELQTSINEKEAKQKAEEEDKLLTNNILEIFGNKQFTSEYAKNGLLKDIKEGLTKSENKGKGIQDIFNELTKDKTDIFINPNQMKDMEGMGDSEENTTKNEMPMFF